MRALDDVPSAGEPRVLFYTHSARAFTSTLIGHLHEIASVFPVVLATEALPEDYWRLLHDRTLFPKLEKIILVQGLGYTLRELIHNNRRWHQLASTLVRGASPTVVVAENDMGSLFEMYLLRAAKRAGAATLAIQAMANFGERDTVDWVELIHLHAGGRDFPGSHLLRRWRLAVRKTAGHLLVHFLLPWSLGEPALRGRSSYVKYVGASGMRDADLNLALTPEVYDEFLERGVPAAKLAVLRHPLARNVPGRLFSPTPPPTASAGAAKRILVLFGFVTLGFDKTQRAPFPSEMRRQVFRDIMRLINRLLPAWQIVLKGHPNWKSESAIVEFLGDLPAAVFVADPRAPVEPMLASSDAILDMPPATSTVLFTASLAWPGKPIIAANVLDEFYGDNYRNSPGVDYAGSWAALEQLLQQIAAETFTEKPAPAPGPAPARRQEIVHSADAVRMVWRASRRTSSPSPS